MNKLINGLKTIIEENRIITGRNIMGASEMFYNPYYLIADSLLEEDFKSSDEYQAITDEIKQLNKLKLNEEIRKELKNLEIKSRIQKIKDMIVYLENYFTAHPISDEAVDLIYKVAKNATEIFY